MYTLYVLAGLTVLVVIAFLAFPIKEHLDATPPATTTGMPATSGAGVVVYNQLPPPTPPATTMFTNGTNTDGAGGGGVDYSLESFHRLGRGLAHILDTLSPPPMTPVGPPNNATPPPALASAPTAPAVPAPAPTAPAVAQVTAPSAIDFPTPQYFNNKPPPPPQARSFGNGDTSKIKTLGMTLPGPPNTNIPGEDDMYANFTKKSSLVPCTCTKFSVGCGKHAGSKDSSKAPGDHEDGKDGKKNRPGDETSAGPAAYTQIGPSEDDIPGFLNSFNAFMH